METERAPFCRPASVFKYPLLLLTVTLLFAGCGRHPAEPAAGTATPKKILNFGNGTEPQDIDPQTVTGIPEWNIIMALFEGLVSYDPHDLHPVPGVAKSWDISADGLVYTFHLREDAKWSDGIPVTAQDFLLSYKRMLTPALASEYAYMIFNYVAGAKDYYDGKLKDFSQVGIKAPDERTLQLTLLNPTPYLLKAMCHMAWFPVPVSTLAKFGGLDKKGTRWTHPENFVGNGPFRLTEWRPNQKLVVERSPTYWDHANVKLDEIDFYPVESADTEERMFRTGQLDITSELPSHKIPFYKRDHPELLHLDPFLGLYFYRCNVQRPPLDNAKVRRALALAIDRESLIKNVVQGDEQPAYAVSYPGTAGYSPQARLTGTVDDARRLLAEAGYPDGHGFPPLELFYNTSEGHRAIAEAIQQMWKKNLNIDVSLRNEEWKVYLDAQLTGNYQLARAGWIADYVDPNAFLDLWETGNANNQTNWGSADYDRLLAASRATRTEEERYAIYQKMDAILADELPIIPIYYYTRVHLMNPKIKGLWPTLLDIHPWQYIDIER
ncbi:MAG TPA: peptide ABC transporter substrate-binding protein [Opitutaceae bacterium]|jgi:oligopeptide transport system substrate-binding protein|nr:peptide ABC transporter substrate-binding protein [Opitutaceae bacterium]